jgi:hypothetical protein
MGSFYTDVISRDARFSSLARINDSAMLEPVTRQLVEGVLSAARQMGIQVMLYETYRSRERQQELFNQGATRLRTVGVHHYGLACDIVRVVSGEPSWKGDFSFQIKHSFVDSVHVQRCTVARQGDLFAGAWYPDSTYNPCDDEQHLFTAATKSPKSTAGKGRPNRKQA